MKILFITWDGPEASYMEGLFMPIFKEITKQNQDVQFHILQFTWNNDTRIKRIEQEAVNNGFMYKSATVTRKPNAAIGSFITVYRGAGIISDYVNLNGINVVMPRSTMPAMMVNLIKNKHNNIKIIFDADGLPLEERLEEKRLTKGSFLYNLLRRQEKTIIANADAVLVRAEYAIDYHCESVAGVNRDKFYKVTNGRNPAVYYPDVAKRNTIRKQLDITDDTLLLIYVGSLGPKYGLREMIALYKKIKDAKANTRFLILTPSVDYVNTQVSSADTTELIIKTIPSGEVNQYLSAADLAFCLINQSLSMQAVSATKLGEYLLAGLPVIATSNIGDADFYLKDKGFCCLLNNHTEAELDKAALWAANADYTAQRVNISLFAQQHFSLEFSAALYLKAINSL